MPSIWITSKSRSERSDAIQSFMRAADSATKRREALDFDLAAVEADLALRFPPAVRPPVTTSRMPWTTDCLCIAIHHLAKGLHAGTQAKQLEACRNLRQ